MICTPETQKLSGIFTMICVKRNASHLQKIPLVQKEWWNHFVKLMNKNLHHPDINFSSMVDNFWSNAKLDVHQLDHEFTCDEIIKAAKHLKKNKAPGIDGVRTEMLKKWYSQFGASFDKAF